VLVPTPLICQIAALRTGVSTVHKSISALAKAGLIAKQKNAKYDGYRLTYGGLDYLALHALGQGKHVYSVGNQIGVGKESDIYIVAGEDGGQRVLKIHRLGRISFRTVKANRDYLRHRSSGSWMYMSRLAAMKEFAFMKALREAGYRTPEPLAQNRHCVVMEFVDAFPMRQVSEVGDPAGLYGELMEMVVRLARDGLIHGDFNEFNILIKEGENARTQEGRTSQEDLTSAKTNGITPVMIDFPQMVSVDHTSAAFYFDRDVACIKRFFSRRFGFTSDEPGPFFADAIKNLGQNGKRLDVDVEASGFSRKMAKELEGYMQDVGVRGDGEADALELDDAESDRDDGLEAPEDGVAADLELSDKTGCGDARAPVDPKAEPEQVHEKAEIGLDRLHLADPDNEGFEDFTAPVKSAASTRKSKKAAGWAI
jgi:RIO kinase 2